MERNGAKKTIRAIAAIAIVATVILLASVFSGCGSERFIITLMDGDEVIDTLITDDEGNVNPYAKDYHKAGYEFVGWYKDKNFNDKIEDSAVFFRNTTIYCKRISFEYTVTFDLDGGKFSKPNGGNPSAPGTGKPDVPSEIPLMPELGNDGQYTLKVFSGDILNVIEPNREHYDFDDWKCNGETVNTLEPFERAADVVYRAQWRAHRSLITYSTGEGGVIVNNDGVPLTSQTAKQYVDYDSAFVPFTAEKRGHSFDGWFINGSDTKLEVTDKWQTESNYSVTARFTPVTYKIVVPNAGGYNTESIVFGSQYDLTAYENPPDGHVFDSWEYTLDGKKGTIKSKGFWDIAGSIELEPIYKANNYSMTLMVGNSEYGTFDVKYGSKVELPPDPKESGKTFAGWFEKRDGTGVRLLPDSYWKWSENINKTFYARFIDESVKATFSVEYYLENADYSGEDVSVKYSKQGGYTANGAIGDTITIDTWGFSEMFENLGFDASDPFNSIKNITLKASPSTLKFYFKRDIVKYAFIDGKNPIVSNDYRVGQTINLGEIIKKTGYNLTGWAIDATENIITPKDFENYKAGALGAILYAQWEAKAYSVSIDDKHIFDIRFNEKLTKENKSKMHLADSDQHIFDGLRIGNIILSPDDINAMDLWIIDGEIETEDGKYSLNFTSLKKARQVYYKVEIWLEDENGNFVLSENHSFEKKADSGSIVNYENGIMKIVDSEIEYSYDAGNDNEKLTIIAGESESIKLYYKRAVAAP